MRKAHKINVFKFVGGNSGQRVPIGFIWRHGVVERLFVPTPNGAATSLMGARFALIVQIAGHKRFVEVTSLAAEGPFSVTLCAWDRDPSGLYDSCPHCEGKGYTAAPKTGARAALADVPSDIYPESAVAREVRETLEERASEREARGAADAIHFENEHGPGSQS